MSVPDKLQGRYEIKEVLGQGGMGLVFRAWDAVVKRDVALKTLRDAPTHGALQMFHKECEVLAAMSHPNIVEIFDIGEFEDDAKSKPYFVMPLLPGAPLDRLIRAASHRLTVERVVDIICQACRGLHAAHERGLVHRDIKPSNVFVLDDDSVKIIDFGVAHMAETGLSIGIKGTLLYMAPEQLQLKPASPASDIYSLGVVCYETLTRRRPFEGTRESEIAEAILHMLPPAVSDLNPAVSSALSRVVQKALAKQPWNRYATAREFAETLQKALRNEPIEFFNPARILPRIERATKAFESGDLQFAAEIVGELESEGHIDPALTTLKRQIEHGQKQETVNQLLEGARTRFEHDEYPLALQKIQDILQLDQGNAQALGLKQSIENRMTTQKVDEWFRLAQQHLENQAWTHAREALSNVLHLRPNEARAAQLTAEVDRLEQEHLRVRKEKDELYRRALEAWDAGEITTALTKMEKVLELDQKAPETGAQERAASYQSFYNKVRTEHESIKNAYAEAKKALADRNFAQALAVVDEWLGKYPGHALFQATKFDIEEQQRQELSARIAGIDRQVEAEPDLERRVSILEEAVARFPGELHFERQLRPMREKRDLVISIAAKARYHEERGQFAEALGQWEILGTIYSQQPGLAFEIERVTRKKEQQLTDEAKARWTSRIEAAANAGDYARASGLCAAAEAEFPGDAALAQLRQLTAGSAARAAEANALLAEAQELTAQRQHDTSLAALRKARELDRPSAVVRTALLSALVERARAVIDTDWRAAEPFIQEALDIDPGHALAKSLRITAQDYKRDESVQRCFTVARQFRAAGDLESALREAETCLAAYPLDPRLAQLRDILSKELREARLAQSRPSDLEAMRHFDQAAASVAEPAEAASLIAQARALAAPYAGDAGFEAILAGIEQRLAAGRDLGPAGSAGAFQSPASVEATVASVPDETPTVVTEPGGKVSVSTVPVAPGPAEPPARPAAPPPPQAAPAQQTPPPEGPDTQPSATSPEPPPSTGTGAAPAGGPPPEPPSMGLEALPMPSSGILPAAGTVPPAIAPPPAGPSVPAQGPAVVPPKAPPSVPPGRLPLRPALLWGIAGSLSVVLLLLFAAIFGPKLHKTGAAESGAVRVDVRTSPPGAIIRVNGKIRGTSNFQLEVPPGSYQIEAALEGYQAVATSADLKAGISAPIELTLHPLPQTVRLITDLSDGKATLDDQPPRDLQDGQVTFDAVSPGKHVLKLASRSGQAELAFELAPGAVPQVQGPPVVKSVFGLVAGSFGSRARVYTTLSPARVQLDGQPAGDVPAEGLQLTNVTPGSRELSVTDGRTELKRVVDFSAAPSLTAFFQSDQNVGTIVVLAGEDGVDVLIDGKKYRYQTSRGGEVRITREPKEYHIRISKEGFQDVPEQVVRIEKGEESKAVFKMIPLPTTAQLQIRGTPGAQVFIDQAAAGTVLPDGTFQVSNLTPGEHEIDLRKDRMHSRPVRKHFAAGQSISLAESETALRGAIGTLRLAVTPSNATVSLVRRGGGPQPATPGTIELEEGSYTVAAHAPGYAERSETVQIAGGQTASLNLVLARDQQRRTQPEPVASGMDGWDAGAWTRDGDWFLRRGGGIALYRAINRPGTYAFNVMLSSGGGLLRGKSLEWVADYTSERDYFLYRFEKEDLHRFRIAGGKKTELPRKTHGLKLKDLLVGVQLEVTPATLTLRLRNGGQWVVSDAWTSAGQNFTGGRFGFRIEGRDEVRLSGFSFTPKE